MIMDNISKNDPTSNDEYGQHIYKSSNIKLLWTAYLRVIQHPTMIIMDNISTSNPTSNSFYGQYIVVQHQNMIL